MDRLVFASAAGGGPASVAGGRVLPATKTAPAAPNVEVTRDGRARMRVHVSGATEPFWLVLGQSDNRGWQASTDGGSLGPRRVVDGYANGWYVQPSKESFDVVLDWTPQRRVWVALWVSLAALILCIAIGLFTWWKRRAVLPLITAPLVTDSEAELDWPARGGRTPSPRVWVTVSLLAAVAGAIIAAPWIGLVVGVVTAIAMRWRLGRVLLAAAPGALVGGIGAYIAIDQHRYHIPPVFEWPTAFPRARTLAWIAVLLIAVFVVVDAARHWRERARAREPDTSS
jgi:hypothetical protein